MGYLISLIAIHLIQHNMASLVMYLPRSASGYLLTSKGREELQEVHISEHAAHIAESHLLIDVDYLAAAPARGAGSDLPYQRLHEKQR